MLNPQINTFTVSRLKRSTKQNIKLGLISESEYTVYGSTGTRYLVKTEPSMNCTCIDYKKNKRYCKHIYFIFLNVYKIVPDLDKVYTEAELKELHTNFYECKMNISARNTDDPCSICFECISDPLVCKKCQNGFHKSCINEMTKYSGKSNCPLCRSNLNENILDDLIKQVELL